MLLNLTKHTEDIPPLPTPPPMRRIDAMGCPVTPSNPAPLSRIPCFFFIHRWEILKESTWKTSNEHGKVISYGPMYILRCVACGKIKSQCL